MKWTLVFWRKHSTDATALRYSSCSSFSSEASLELLEDADVLPPVGALSGSGSTCIAGAAVTALSLEG